MIKRRWYAACLLYNGYSIREAAEKAKMSTGTISKISQILKEGRKGLFLAVCRVQKDIKNSEKKHYKFGKSSRGIAHQALIDLLNGKK